MADSKLPGIEEEFAELDRELKRLAAMPLRTREQQNALLMALESLRDGWQKKGRAPDAPGWRRVIDEAISTAFDGLLAEMRADAGDPTKAAQAGSVSLDPRLLQRHFRPVFDAIADGLRKNLVQKFRGPQQPGAPTPEVDSADVAAILLTLFGPTKKK